MLLFDAQLLLSPQALQHLEMQLINVACDDPGAAIGANMALPLLQDRLDACARKFAEERALEAQEALFLTEVRHGLGQYRGWVANAERHR